MAAMFDDIIKEIPGYKVILKSVIKSQIQHLVEQLSATTDEESVVLTASVSDGTLGHLGSDSGKAFLRYQDDLKLQFLGFCLKNQYEKRQLERQLPEARDTLHENHKTNDLNNSETYTATTFVSPRTSDSIYNITSNIPSSFQVTKSSGVRFEPYTIPKSSRRSSTGLYLGQNTCTRVSNQTHLQTETQFYDENDESSHGTIVSDLNANEQDNESSISYLVSTHIDKSKLNIDTDTTKKNTESSEATEYESCTKLHLNIESTPKETNELDTPKFEYDQPYLKTKYGTQTMHIQSLKPNFYIESATLEQNVESAKTNLNSESDQQNVYFAPDKHNVYQAYGHPNIFSESDKPDHCSESLNSEINAVPVEPIHMSDSGTPDCNAEADELNSHYSGIPVGNAEFKKPNHNIEIDKQDIESNKSQNSSDSKSNVDQLIKKHDNEQTKKEDTLGSDFLDANDSRKYSYCKNKREFSDKSKVCAGTDVRKVIHSRKEKVQRKRSQKSRAGQCPSKKQQPQQANTRMMDANATMAEELINAPGNMIFKSEITKDLATEGDKHIKTTTELKEGIGECIHARSEAVVESQSERKMSESLPGTTREAGQTIKTVNDNTYVSKLRSSRSLRRKYEVNSALKLSKARQTCGRRVGRPKAHAKMSSKEVSSSIGDSSVPYNLSRFKGINMKPFVKCIDAFRNGLNFVTKDRTTSQIKNYCQTPDAHLYRTDDSLSRNFDFPSIDKIHVQMGIIENATGINQNEKKTKKDIGQKIKHTLTKQETSSDSDSEIEIIAVEPGNVFFFDDTFFSKFSNGSVTKDDKRNSRRGRSK